MSEDEQKKDETTETPQDETPEAAGPVVEEGVSEAALGSSPDEGESPAESEGRGTDAASASDTPPSTPPG